MSFTHLSDNDQPQMVDIGGKSPTERLAVAQAIVQLDATILEQFKDDDIHTKKGSVFQTSVLAGIMGSKKTSELIPLCHPLALNSTNVTIQMNDKDEVVIQCTAKITGKTGVEMEALTGASIAALNIYDMCKGFSHNIIIKEIKLLKKTGGKRHVDTTQ